MRMHLHPLHLRHRHDEVPNAPTGLAAWWDGVPVQAAAAPVIHAARAAELLDVPVPVVHDGAHQTAA